MARKKKKAPTRKANDSPTRSSPKKKTSKPQREAPRMIIRRNAAPVRRTRDDEAAERRPLTTRIDEMGGSHVAAGVGFGALGNVMGVVAVGQGWIGPKTTAATLMGVGTAATAAGWYTERDHLMAAGIGLTAAGAFSISNQLAVDAYEAMEKRAEEKRAKKEAARAEEERAKRLAEARALLEKEEKEKPRNARRVVVVNEYDEHADPGDDEYSYHGHTVN